MVLSVFLLHAVVFLQRGGVRSGWHNLGSWMMQRWVAYWELRSAVSPVSSSTGLGCDFNAIDGRKSFGAAGVRGSPAVVRSRVCAVACIDDRQGGVTIVDGCVTSIVRRKQYSRGQRWKRRSCGSVVSRLRGSSRSLDRRKTITSR